MFDVSRGTGIDGVHDGIAVRRTMGIYLHQRALATRS